MVRGLPLFLFPGGVQCRAVLGILLCGILITWPSHLILLCFIPVLMFLLLHFRCRFLLLILLGQKSLFIFLGQLLWKASTFFHIALYYTPAFWPIQEDWLNIAVVELEFGPQAVVVWLPDGLELGESCTSFFFYLAFISFPAQLSLLSIFPR